MICRVHGAFVAHNSCVWETVNIIEFYHRVAHISLYYTNACAAQTLALR